MQWGKNQNYCNSFLKLLLCNLLKYLFSTTLISDKTASNLKGIKPYTYMQE